MLSTTPNSVQWSLDSGFLLRESTEQETWPPGLQASTRIWGALATNLASLAAVTPVWGADVALAGPLAVDGAHTIHQQTIPDFPRFCCLRRRTEWNLTGAVEMKTQASTDSIWLIWTEANQPSSVLISALLRPPGRVPDAAVLSF